MAPKKKTEKMSLGTFLQDENYGSWADEMEDMPLPSTESRTTYSSERRAFSSTNSMGNGYPERREYTPREQLPLPTQPPYTAHLANLSFDATQGDIGDFFKDCQVTNVRIVEDKLDRKPKGFGYVEFATLDGLKAALALSGSSLGGRQVRISVAEPQAKERQDARDFSDWSRKGPLPDLPQRKASDRGGFGNRSFDNMSDAGSERGGRRGFEQGDGKLRDFSNWERKGPLSPVTPTATSLREGGRQGSKDGSAGFRKNSPAWGEGRSQEGSRPRREFNEKPVPERQPTASELDNQWRARMRPDAPAVSPTPEATTPSNPSSPAIPAAPATRPKLNLQKRTVSEADPTAATTSGTDSKASPFGAARPVDTSAREKELDEKRQLTIRQRKEAEEKTKADKAEEKRAAKEKVETPKNQEGSVKSPKETTQSKETAEEPQQATPKFDILRRADTGMNDMVADDENDDEHDEGTKKIDTKSQDVPSTKTNGSWRQNVVQSPTEEATAATLEEDGWSTVSKSTKQRGNKRNTTRATAS